MIPWITMGSIDALQPRNFKLNSWIKTSCSGTSNNVVKIFFKENYKLSYNFFFLMLSTYAVIVTFPKMTSISNSPADIQSNGYAESRISAEKKKKHSRDTMYRRRL